MPLGLTCGHKFCTECILHAAGAPIPQWQPVCCSPAQGACLSNGEGPAISPFTMCNSCLA